MSKLFRRFCSLILDYLLIVTILHNLNEIYNLNDVIRAMLVLTLISLAWIKNTEN